jgi:hypothetical protein
MITTKDNTLRAIRREQPAWVPNGMEAVVTILPPVVERPTAPGYDAFGVHWSLEPDAEGGTFPTKGGNTIRDLAQWRMQIAIPDVSRLDWSEVRAQVGQIDRRQFLMQGFIEMGLFERSYLLLGMEEALMAYLLEPRTMYEVLAAIADYKIALIRAFYQAVQPDIIWYGDDWGTQSSLFIAPDTWRLVIKPHMARIYRCIHEPGMLINMHSCGKIESIFADIVEMGVDMWNPCQPCNDLAMLKRRFGQHISFCGGIDSQFVLGKPGVTTDEVRQEVRGRIDALAQGGGYIAAPSHSVPFDEAIIAAMNDEINSYGRDCYNRPR